MGAAMMSEEQRTRFGTCPWCGKHEVPLCFAVGQYRGRLWTDWICHGCLEAAREIPAMKCVERRKGSESVTMI